MSRPPHNKPMNARPRAAFTLLELMVSMSILAILIILLMSIVDASTKLWRQNENRVDSYREARAALNVIVSDLSSMYVSANTNFFQYDDGDDKKTLFLTALPSDSQEPGDDKSDICEVSYQRRKGRTSVRTRDSYNLYRGFRSSSPTFTNLNDAGPLPPNPPEEVLARNVSAFKIDAYSVDPAGSTTKFDPKNPKTPMPDLLVVHLTALNQETVAKFKDSDDWKNTNSFFYKNNARTFTVRVRLRTQGITFASPTPTPVPTPTPTPVPAP